MSDDRDALSEGLANLARDLRETRADLARIEETLAVTVAKLRDLATQVFTHRRDAVNGLVAVEREIAEVTRVAAADVGSLALRVQALEAGRPGQTRR